MGMPAKTWTTPKWKVVVTDLYDKDSARLGLSPNQQDHVIDIFLHMAVSADPFTCAGVDLKKLVLTNGEAIGVLRDCKGILKQREITAFFGLDHAHGSIVLLGIIDVPHEDKIPPGITVSMDVRWRKYRDRN